MNGSGRGQVAGCRVTEHAVADLHRQRRHVQGDSLASPRQRAPARPRCRRLTGDQLGRVSPARTIPTTFFTIQVEPGPGHRPRTHRRVYGRPGCGVLHAGPRSGTWAPDREDHLRAFLGNVADASPRQPRPPPPSSPAGLLLLQGVRPSASASGSLHVPQAQRRRLLPASAFSFGGLGLPALPSVVIRRVMGGAGLPGSRYSGSTAEKLRPRACGGCADPRPRERSTLVIGQVLQDRRLPGRTGRHRGIIARDGSRDDAPATGCSAAVPPRPREAAPGRTRARRTPPSTPGRPAAAPTPPTAPAARPGPPSAVPPRPARPAIRRRPAGTGRSPAAGPEQVQRMCPGDRRQRRRRCDQVTEHGRPFRHGLQQAFLQAQPVLQVPPLRGQRVNPRPHVRTPASDHRVPPPRLQRRLRRGGEARRVALLDQPRRRTSSSHRDPSRNTARKSGTCLLNPPPAVPNRSVNGCGGGRLPAPR